MDHSSPLYPRRSVLYVPANSEKALHKAPSLKADSIIFDLEDAIAPHVKEKARHSLLERLQNYPNPHQEIAVRINTPNTLEGKEDIKALKEAPFDALVVPKISNVEDLKTASTFFDKSAVAKNPALWAMIETAESILNIADIAAYNSVQTHEHALRLSGLIMGINDLAKQTRAALTPTRTPMLGWFSSCILAARANKLFILDGVLNQWDDEEALQSECQQGRQLGFDGKTLIHPAQIEAANKAYSPSNEEIKHAHAIIEAFEKDKNKDKGAIALNGAMIERLHYKMALQTIEITEFLKQRDRG